MDEKQPQDPQSHAADLQQQINDLHTQADTAGGDEKESIMDRIKKLEEEKTALMQKFQGYQAEATKLEGEAKTLEGEAGSLESGAKSVMGDLHL